MKLKPQVRAAEQQLAAALLKCLSGNGSPLEAIVQAEEISCCIFINAISENSYRAEKPILEALIKLSEMTPMLRSRFLSCLVVLAACSPASWMVAASSPLFQRLQELSQIILACIVLENRSCQGMPQQFQEQLSDQLLNLSDVQLFRTLDEFPLRIPTTPLQLAVDLFTNNPSFITEHDTHPDQPTQDALQSLIERVPTNCWQSLGKARCQSLFNIALALGIETGSLPNAGDAVLENKSMSIGELEQRSEQSGKKVLDSDLLSNDHVYAWVKANGESEKEHLKTKCQVWLKEKKFIFVAVAYLAAPKSLSNIINSIPNVQELLGTLPPKYRSSIDHDIEVALTRLLAAIPETKPLFPPMPHDDTDALNQLKRMALLHPFVVLRHMKTINAICTTVLEGISVQARYENASLHLLEALLGVLIALPLPLPDLVERLGVKILGFLLQEKRDENGIPGFMIAVTVSVLKLLGRFGLDQNKTQVRKTVETMKETNKGNPGIYDAASELLSTSEP